MRPKNDWPDTRERKLALALVATIASTTALACKPDASHSKQQAEGHAAALARTAAGDHAEIARGMPEGAKRMTARMSESSGDVLRDPQLAYKALLRVRREVPDLNVAKSTFFALTDAKGKVVRSDQEHDELAGRDLASVLPTMFADRGVGLRAELGDALVPSGHTRKERQWAIGLSVGNTDSREKSGVYITGFTYRLYARRMAEVLKGEIAKENKDRSAAKAPLTYVALFDKTGVYGAHPMPEANEVSLGALDLVGKTSAGAAGGLIKLDERTFGYGAARLPEYGADIGVVVMRSEL